MLAIVLPGQVYYHEQLNEYLVVTRANRGDISYSGPGFRGNMEVETFLSTFQPVDVDDLEEGEALTLVNLAGTQLKTGYVAS